MENSASLVPAMGRRILLSRFATVPVLGALQLASSRAALGRSHVLSVSKPQSPKPGKTSPATPLPIVMLDPGHGGKDPGAIGFSGTYEKHVALAAALELQRQLQASGRYRVELTRRQDIFIPLEGRVALALERGASLFVSIHADAIADPSIRGASVYTLSNGPSDLQTAALAARENNADRFVSHSRHHQSHDFAPDMSEIIMNMGRDQARANSARMARDLVASLDDDLPMLSRPERHAAFVVLKSGSIPSVLVEMGFMSNPRDEAALRKPGHRKLVARAMSRAVDAYFSAGRSTT